MQNIFQIKNTIVFTVTIKKRYINLKTKMRFFQ